MSSTQLLEKFQATFAGTQYKHRNANLGNRIADYLYEDLFRLGLSRKFVERVESRERALNPKGISPGIRARRGDGSFGDIVPGCRPALVEGFLVPRASTANVEIGAEVKILAKAMIKQIDRVINDMRKQAEHFKRKSPDALAVGIVGICCSASYTSYEGDRSYTTTGKADAPHPCQEAGKARGRLLAEVAAVYDEFLALEFDATNAPPFPFAWASPDTVAQEYGALLVRLSRQYDRTF